RRPTQPSRSRLGAMTKNEAKGVAIFTTRELFEYGGVAASIVLVAFGIAAIVLGVNGRSTVHNNLALEQIVGTPDMTPSAIKAEAKQARLPASIKLPTVAVAGQTINRGSRARAFATYMRIHALEATHGYTYAQMGRFAAKPGTPASQLAKGAGPAHRCHRQLKRRLRSSRGGGREAASSRFRTKPQTHPRATRWHRQRGNRHWGYEPNRRQDLHASPLRSRSQRTLFARAL